MFQHTQRKKSDFLPPIFLFSLVVFFWTLFDATLGFITPLLIAERGFSLGMIGLIIGSSSVTGAIFDFIICKLFKNSDFRRMLLMMFVLCIFYPLVLSRAETLWIFLFAMAMWGIYFDFYSFSVFNFVGRYTKKDEHAESFGVVQIFRALGAMIAPFIVGFLIFDMIDQKPFILSWIFLGIGFILFCVLLILMRKNMVNDKMKDHVKKQKSFFVEIYLWKKLGKIMTPVLCITFFLTFVDAFFWTLAPLYIETLDMGKFGGIFLTAYILPSIFVGWFVGGLTHNFGKKDTALLGIFIGSTILMSFVYVTSSIGVLVVVFLASCFLSIASPSISAAFADYISESPRFDGEIEGIADLSANSAYIVGPIVAGILANFLGIPAAFSILGLIGIVLGAVLLATIPKNIVVKIAARKM